MPTSKVRVSIGLSLALGLVGSAPLGQLPEYDGLGFVGATATQLSASHVETMDLDGDGLQDLIALESDGAITANLELAARSHWLRLEGFSAIAVTRTGGERLWAIQSNRLFEVRASDLEGTTTPAPTGISLPGIVSLAAQDRPGGARLVCVDQFGGHVAVYGLSQGRWQLVQERFPSPTQGGFLDAALVDWDGNGLDWLAVISYLGVHVYDPSGAEIVSVGGDPAGAFLDVIPGAATQWGHDLMAYHHRTTRNDPHLLWLANAFHGEIHFAPNIGLREIELADFLAAPGRELILSTGSDRSVWLMRQTVGGTEQDNIFQLDLSDVFTIDLDQGAASPPTAAPASAVADVDGDGDEDLVYIDDLGRKIVVVSQFHDEDMDRPTVVTYTPSIPQGQPFVNLWLQADVELPPAAAHYDLEVWYRPELGAPLGPEPMMFLKDLPAGLTTVNLPNPSDSSPVYQFVFRAIDTGAEAAPLPALIHSWSPDDSVNDLLKIKAGQDYAWKVISTKAGGGTTRDPVTGPPGVGGPG